VIDCDCDTMFPDGNECVQFSLSASGAAIFDNQFAAAVTWQRYPVGLELISAVFKDAPCVHITVCILKRQH